MLRTGGAAGTVTVKFATGNGTAQTGTDFTGTSGTLTFGDGEVSKVFTVPLLNDTDAECNEAVILSLFQPTGGAVACLNTNAALVIADDDGILAGGIEAVTVNTNAVLVGGSAFDSPTMSADGRFVAFQSANDSIAPGGNPFATDVYVRDLTTHTSQLVSPAAGGQVARLSGDGRFVSFVSGGQIYRHDMGTGSNELVTVDTTGGPANAREYKGMLVVLQTSENHEKVEKLLNLMYSAANLDAKVKVSR